MNMWIDQLLDKHDHEAPTTGHVLITGGEAEPLLAITAHKHDGHWHFITLGLSELGEKMSKDPDRSGWGFELTLRAPDDGDNRPAWPKRTLQQLASYVIETGSPLGTNHLMPLGGPMDDDTPEITALAITIDPQLGEHATPNGSLAFLQIVGLRSDEAELASRWSVPDLITILRERDPMLVTRPERSSVLDDRELAAELERRAASEGSRGVKAFAYIVRWRIRGWFRRSISIEIGTARTARKSLSQMLPELRRGRTVHVASEGRTLTFSLATDPRWRVNAERLDVDLSSTELDELIAFFNGDAVYFTATALPSLVLKLVD